ncbi:MAG: phosphoribosylformimino-5-aminoimidazole carboxamide ribotide isomerase [Clostridium sp.]|nr:phosphoribosylformimino-5-aminoimidazole carboxamide ribotide isomerase [Clostridium sp.]
MDFRPCIDIHDGKVRQIVGGSLKDSVGAKVNFETDKDGVFYANLYKDNGLKGGHIILLNPVGTEMYEADKKLALGALNAYRGGLQIGGGISADNAKEFIEAGASHVIVTSYVFKDGKVNYENLDLLEKAVGKEHIVLDLSCRKKDGKYYIVTDRWQKFTDVVLNADTLDELLNYCDEFLIHAVDVEGKCNGIEEEIAILLGNWGKCTITYAGGVSSYEDIEKLKKLSNNKLNVTIGSALDLFGGLLEFKKVLEYCK